MFPSRYGHEARRDVKWSKRKEETEKFSLKILQQESETRLVLTIFPIIFPLIASIFVSSLRAYLKTRTTEYFVLVLFNFRFSNEWLKSM